MMTSHAEQQAVQIAITELELPLSAVEERLASLADALSRHDADGIELEAAGLHRALASAVQHFGHAARVGGVPPVLRQRLAVAGGQVAAQREALARATASLDRAIDVLLPQSSGSTYAYGGGNERLTGSGSLMA